jgi:hypothetical protein
MKTLQFIIFGILIGLCSCENNKNKDKEIEVFNFSPPIVQDTFITDRIERSTVWLQNGNYNPLYIGQRKDSIYVSYRPNLKKYFVYDDNKRSYGRPDSSGIILLIDTTKFISDHSMIWEDDGSMLSTKSFKAFTVFVVNTTKDTLSIGYGDHLPIIMEAKDSMGNWRPIEEPYMYMCGTGLNGIILPPNEIVVTSAPINKGKVKTKLRLRYNNILSQEFYGTINPTQFDSKYDESGEPKPLPKE